MDHEKNGKKGVLRSEIKEALGEPEMCHVLRVKINFRQVGCVPHVVDRRKYQLCRYGFKG